MVDWNVGRLAVDAACITASVYNIHSSMTLNVACLVGSVGLLFLRMPSIYKKRHDPLFIIPGVIDILQVVLCTGRFGLLSKVFCIWKGLSMVVLSENCLHDVLKTV